MRQTHSSHQPLYQQTLFEIQLEFEPFTSTATTWAKPPSSHELFQHPLSCLPTFLPPCVPMAYLRTSVMALSSQHSPTTPHAIKIKGKFHTKLHKALGSLPPSTLADPISCGPHSLPTALTASPWRSLGSRAPAHSKVLNPHGPSTSSTLCSLLSKRSFTKKYFLNEPFPGHPYLQLYPMLPVSQDFYHLSSSEIILAQIIVSPD